MLIDLSVENQTYVEDCERCCNPIAIRYRIENGEIADFEAEKAY